MWKPHCNESYESYLSNLLQNILDILLGSFNHSEMPEFCSSRHCVEKEIFFKVVEIVITLILVYPRLWIGQLNILLCLRTHWSSWIQFFVMKFNRVVQINVFWARLQVPMSNGENFTITWSRDLMNKTMYWGFLPNIWKINRKFNHNFV